MIKPLLTTIRSNNRQLNVTINKTESELSIDHGRIKVHTVENLFAIRYLNFIHYTQNQSDVIHIINNTDLIPKR
jgi:hypothetical protein